MALGNPILLPGQAVRSLRISGSPVLTATQGRPYTGFALTGGGGVAPLVYGVDTENGPPLPPAVVVNPATGAVSTGVLQAAGVISGIVLDVVDADGRVASLDAFDLTVAAPVEIAGTPLTTATVGASYHFAVTGSEGTAPIGYTVHAGTLPAGATLDPDTGDVDGPTTAVETKTGIVLRATDAYGSVADLAPFNVVSGVVHTAVTTQDSADIVLDDVTLVAEGQTATGAGIPAATTVLSIDTLTVTLSAAATATATGVAVTFTA